MFLKSHKPDLVLKILSWGILFFSVTCYFANMDELKYSILFSSDSVGLPCLYRDITEDGGNLKDWMFAAVPSLFPDILVYSIMKETIDPSVQASGYIYAVFMAAAICWLSVNVFKKMAPENLKKYSWLIPMMFSTLFIESYYFSKDMTFGWLLTSYQYHGGAYFNFLVGLSIYLSSLSNRIKYPLLLVFSAIAVFNDILYIVLLIFPLSAAVILDIKNKGFRTAILVAVCSVAGMLLGHKAFALLKASGIGWFAEPHKMLAFDFILPSLKMFTSEMIDFLKIPGLRSLLLLFTFTSMIALPVILFIKRKTMEPRKKFLFVFFVIFSFSVFLAPIINGNYSGYDTIRYSIFPFYFALIMIAIFVGDLLENKWKNEKIKKLILIALPSLFIILTILKFSPKKLDSYFAYVPQRAKDIDSVCAKYHLKKGLSEYWTARQTTVFSEHRIKLMAVYPITCMNEFASNKSYYYDTKFDFVVADQLNGDSLRNKLVIKDTIQTKTCMILRVEDYVFRPGEAFPFTPIKQKSDSVSTAIR
jgi:hypothetical protein